MGIGQLFVQAVDLAGAGGAGVDSRPNLIANPVLPKSERTFFRHFNTEAVAPSTQAQFGIGAMSPDPIRGPGLQVWDVSRYKNIPFGDVRKLQLRFEFYNFFNHTNFSAVDTGVRFQTATVGAAQVNTRFGNYTPELDARRIVLGARFAF